MNLRNTVLLTLACTTAILGMALRSPTDKPIVKTGEMAKGIAIVELFTSEGCSSCPPADVALSAMVERAQRTGEPLFALSYHVDYWNRLGWRDPYSSAQWSARQRDYASRTGDGVYTPQSVVNGSASFVGSDRDALDKAVTKALAAQTAVVVSGSAVHDAAGVSVTYSLTGELNGAVLNVALVEGELETKVKAGENRGRTLAHTNVVRALETIPLHEDARNGTVVVKLPAGSVAENVHAILFVQEEKLGSILGAAEVDITGVR